MHNPHHRFSKVYAVTARSPGPSRRERRRVSELILLITAVILAIGLAAMFLLSLAS
jgi:hypothetical protein